MKKDKDDLIIEKIIFLALIWLFVGMLIYIQLRFNQSMPSNDPEQKNEIKK